MNLERSGNNYFIDHHGEMRAPWAAEELGGDYLENGFSVWLQRLDSDEFADLARELLTRQTYMIAEPDGVAYRVDRQMRRVLEALESHGVSVELISVLDIQLFIEGLNE